MKNISQLLLGLLAATGTSFLILGAVSLALVESGTPVAGLQTQSAEGAATQGTQPAGGLTITAPPLPTNTQIQPTACPIPAGWSPYSVQPGDTLESIVKQFGGSADQIIKANCLPGSSLFSATILYLPSLAATNTAPATLPTALPTLAPSSTSTATSSVSASAVPSAVVARTVIACGPPPGWVVYIVRPGDNLYRISVAVNYTQEAIRFANCMTGSSLAAGQRLYVPFIPASIRTPTFTNTPEPPSPTDTDVVIPTNTMTPVTPTVTPVTPTDTPVIPTETPVTPTATTAPAATEPVAPSSTPETPTAESMVTTPDAETPQP